MSGPFSHRHGYGAQREISIREEAPEVLRAGLVSIGRDFGSLASQQLLLQA